jgi:hypothetical protein
LDRSWSLCRLGRGGSRGRLEWSGSRRGLGRRGRHLGKDRPCLRPEVAYPRAIGGGKDGRGGLLSGRRGILLRRRPERTASGRGLGWKRLGGCLAWKRSGLQRIQGDLGGTGGRALGRRRRRLGRRHGPPLHGGRNVSGRLGRRRRLAVHGRLGPGGRLRGLRGRRSPSAHQEIGAYPPGQNNHHHYNEYEKQQRVHRLSPIRISSRFGDRDIPSSRSA